MRAVCSLKNARRRASAQQLNNHMEGTNARQPVMNTADRLKGARSMVSAQQVMDIV
tara:strand:+ start:1172 stop:1339 length:168 start_codon:yes stop_codon:yes gene_type:complete